MKTITTILIYLSINIFAINTDSLKQVIVSEKNPQLIIDAQNSLAWELRYTLPDSTLNLLQRAIVLSYKNNYKEGLAKALNYYGCSGMLYGMFNQANDSLNKSIKLYQTLQDTLQTGKVIVNKGLNFFYQSNLDSAIFYVSKALPYVKSDSKALATAYLNLELFYRKKGDFSKAIEFGIKALDIFEKINNLKLLSITENNIGNLFFFEKKYDKAIEYHNKAIETAEKINYKPEIASALISLSHNYQELNMYDTAFYLVKKAMKILSDNKQTKDYYIAAFSLSNLYFDTKQYEKALVIYDSLRFYFNQIKDIASYTACINGIGIVYYEQNMLDSAKKYLEKSYELLNYVDDPFLYKAVILDLANIYEKTGNTDEALLLHKKYEAVKDSLYKIEVIKQTAEVDAKYNLKKLKKHIGDIEQKNTKIKNKLYISILLVILVIAGIILLFYFYRKKSKLLKESTERQNYYLEKYKTLKASYEEVLTKLEKIQFLKSQTKDTGETVKIDSLNIEKLSKRELEVLSWLSVGLLDKEIADKLDISIATVRTHLRKIYKKLNINNRTEAASIVKKFENQDKF